MVCQVPSGVQVTVTKLRRIIMFMSSFASIAGNLAILVLVADLYWVYLLIFLGAVIFNYAAEVAFRDTVSEESR